MCKGVKKKFITIREEAVNVHNKYKLINFGDIHNNTFMNIDQKDNKWNIFPIKFYGKINDYALKICPNTCKIIEKCKDIQAAFFSILEPGKYIPPHKGPCNNYLRYHLALKIPKDQNNCYIKINNIKYIWNEGESIIFDDTYIHEVYNNTNEPRIVLFMDINRPVKSIFKNISIKLSNYAKFTNFVKTANDNIEKHYVK